MSVFLAPRSQVLRSTISRTIPAVSQRRSYVEDVGRGKTHLNEKTGAHRDKDVQSEASSKGHDSRAEGSHQSQATSQKDVRNNNERAKQEFPEAPEPIIGMNEERGKKGH